MTIDKRYNNINKFVIYIYNGYIYAIKSEGDIVFKGVDARNVIQNCVDMLKGGGEILMKDGIYAISSTINIADNFITIEGESWNTILRLTNACNIITVGAAPGQIHSERCVFKNFKIDGQNNIYGVGHGIAGSMKSCYLDSLWILNVPQDGVRYDTGTGNRLINCTITNSGRYGIVPIGTDSHIQNCLISQSIDAGIYLCGSATFIEHNHIWGCKYGIQMAPTNSIVNCIIHGCYIESNKGYGIVAMDHSVWDSVIDSNNFWNNGESDIYVNPIDSYVFRNNIINGDIFNGNAITHYAINMENGDNSCIISNNIFKSYIKGKIVFTGNGHIIKNNKGFITEANKLSTFIIDSIGIKTITMDHGLDITPRVQDCCLAIIQNTAVDDWTYNMLKIVSTDAKNVTVKINISTASATIGATAKLALRVGNP